MNKKEIIEQLKALQAQGCEIAEVVVDISAPGESEPCYPNENFLVYLVKEPSNDDLITGYKHWYICSSITDFKKGVVFGERSARRLYCKYFVSKVHCVKEFKSDFNE